MEIAAITIAIWLILLGLYGIWPLLRRDAEDTDDIRTVATVWQPQRGKTLSFLPERPAPQINPVMTATMPRSSYSHTTSEAHYAHAQAPQLHSELTTATYRRRDVGQKRPRFRRADQGAKLQHSVRRQPATMHTVRRPLGRSA
jgi:hypothetical protein